MKKFLLPLAALALTAGMASAETVTFDFVNETYGLERLSGSTQDYIDEGTTIENEGVTLTFTSSLGTASANESGTRLWKDGLRCYKGGCVTVSVDGATIDDVTYTATGSDFSLDKTSWTISYTKTSSNQAIKTLTVEYTPTGNADLKPAELSFTHADIDIELGDEVPENALINPNELPVTWTSSNEEVATVDENGVVTVKAEGTTTITAASEETEEFRAGKASYVLTVVKVVKAASIAEMLSIGEADKNTEMVVNFPMTVTYVNGSNTYVTDGEGFTLLYGNSIAKYEKDDVIPAGWTAKYSPYNGLPEFVATTTMEAATEKGEFTPREVALADVTAEMVNEVIIIPSVTFADATPAAKSNFDGTCGDATLLFRNNFTIASVEAGSYSVTAVPGIYNGTIQVYPIEYGEETGVAGIEAENGAAVYYNMQGVRVENPANGLYIVVRGGKAVKQVIR